MHGLAEYEIGRQYREEIRQEVAVYRLERELRASRGGSRLARDLGWELSRYAGLLAKHLRFAKGGQGI